MWIKAGYLGDASEMDYIIFYYHTLNVYKPATPM